MERKYLLSAGECPVCSGSGALILVKDRPSARILVLCPSCGTAWPDPPSGFVDKFFALSDLSSEPVIATHEDLAASAKTHLIRSELDPGLWIEDLAELGVAFPTVVPDDVTLVGSSGAILRVRDLLRRMANVDAPVLIEGELGTEVDVAAVELHRQSLRADRDFFVLSCIVPEPVFETVLFGHVKGAFTGALSDKKGALEQAGTIVLNDIDALSLQFQARLLRVLETREFRPIGSTQSLKTAARILATTHRGLRELVASGRFREDLFYRLSTVTVSLPPLRERKEDVWPIVEDFARRVSGPASAFVSHDVLPVLLRHDWPGNVRELRSVLTTALARVHGREIHAEDLPTPLTIGRASSYADAMASAMASFERAYILSLLELYGGDVASAAEAAKIPPSVLKQKLERLGSQSAE